MSNSIPLQKITSLNLDGKLSNLIQFEEKISKHNPLICVLQDIPKLNKESLLNTCHTIANNYNVIYDNEKLTRQKKIYNLILTDKERVNVTKIHMFRDRIKVSILAISVNCIRDENDECVNSFSKLIIFNVYIRPRASHSDTKKCFELIEETARQHEGLSRMIIIGDMNATETTWCPVECTMSNRENSASHYRQIKLIRGRIISTATNKMKASCLNKVSQGPTFVHTRGNAYIDLAFVGNKALRTWQSMTLEKLSDNSPHRILILHAKGPLRVKFKKRCYKRIQVAMLNESLFEELHIQCDSLCVNWKQLPRDRIIIRLEHLTNTLYKAISIAQEKVTTRITKKVRSDTRGGIYNRAGVQNVRIRKYLRRLRKHEVKLLITGARERRLRIRNERAEPGYNVPHNAYSVLKQALRTKVLKLRQFIINNLNINNLNSENSDLIDKELWERVHLIDNSLNPNSSEINLDNASNRINTQEDLDDLAIVKFPFKNRGSLNYVNEANMKSPNSIRCKLSEDEIIIAVLELRKKSYTSSVGIRMDVFYNSLMHATNIISTIAEMSFWTCYIPKIACITQGTLIPKKTPGQFRIVHVSSPLAALLEIIALRRLEYRLEIMNLNSPYQFGFAALVGRHDLIARVLEFFLKSYIHDGETATGLIFSLDIEGAFDNVNQDILIQKMEHELGDDPIKYWLANFILNRQIRIKRGSLKSQARHICMGVPQGSALGPILWNYTISKLDVNICIPCRAELVRYADDIILIYNGSSKDEIQSVLDKLVYKLKRLDLNIRPEKCSVMGVRLGMHDGRRNLYRINGTEIKKVKWLNLLGVPITNKLKLYRGSEEHKLKLMNSIKKLHSLNKLGYIKTAKEWNILIESYIKSRLVLNCWPVLLIDDKSCKWTDDMMIKALRLIFGWPSNTSTKLIQLITSNLDSKTVVKRLATQRTFTELGGIYDFLIHISSSGRLRQLMQLERSERLARANEFLILNLETDIRRQRKHPDPTKTIRINHVARIESEINNTGPTWVILEKNAGSMMAEISLDNQVTSLRIGKHREYPISYFNTFCTLLKASTDRLITYRCLTLNDTNSLLGAIENPFNKDWRVIQLRERMFDNGWRINKVSQSEGAKFISCLAAKYNGIGTNNVTGTIANDLSLWLKGMTDRSDIELTPYQPVARLSTQIESFEEPYLLDYKRRNFVNKWAPVEDQTMFQRLHTRITRILCSRVSVWQGMNPSWINGTKMLALSGLYTNSRGQLEHAARNPSETCNLCEDLADDGTRRYATTGPSGIPRESICQNVILHRAFMCRAKIDLQEQFLTQIRPQVITDNATRTGREFIEQILSDHKVSQRFLTYLVKCAFEGHNQ